MSRYTLRTRPIEQWPGQLTRDRRRSPFTGTWTSTLEILDRELDHLRADPATVVLQVAIREQDLRLDGQLRANARPAEHPGVILSFTSRRLGPLSYPCDAFETNYRRIPGWQANVRAIALGLEALRKVQRYGIAPSDQQYTGWKQLGAGTPMPAAQMSVEEAAALLIEHGEVDGAPPGDPDLLIDGPFADEIIEGYFRRAVKRCHPDVGGDPDLFRRISDARFILGRHRCAR